MSPSRPLLSPITNLQHSCTGHTVMQPENITIKKYTSQKYRYTKNIQYMPAQSGAGELAEGVPEHLEPLAADVEEHGAVRLPGLGVQLGRGHGVGASAANQSISGQIRVSKG